MIAYVKTLFSNKVTLWGTEGLGLQLIFLGGYNLTYNVGTARKRWNLERIKHIANKSVRENRKLINAATSKFERDNHILCLMSKEKKTEKCLEQQMTEHHTTARIKPRV